MFARAAGTFCIWRINGTFDRPNRRRGYNRPFITSTGVIVDGRFAISNVGRPTICGIGTVVRTANVGGCDDHRAECGYSAVGLAPLRHSRGKSEISVDRVPSGPPTKYASRTRKTFVALVGFHTSPDFFKWPGKHRRKPTRIVDPFAGGYRLPYEYRRITGRRPVSRRYARTFWLRRRPCRAVVANVERSTSVNSKRPIIERYGEHRRVVRVLRTKIHGDPNMSSPFSLVGLVSAMFFSTSNHRSARFNYPPRGIVQKYRRPL